MKFKDLHFKMYLWYSHLTRNMIWNEIHLILGQTMDYDVKCKIVSHGTERKFKGGDTRRRDGCPTQTLIRTMIFILQNLYSVSVGL